MPTSDYFAEMYVAGRFADAGWNVYFPRRDNGFDFIIARADTEIGPIIRPVQVKGKYPEKGTGDRGVYGYIGSLAQIHQDMVLAIPFFSNASNDMPFCTAYLPLALLRPNARGYRCQPASLVSGKPVPRRDYRKFFDKNGLDLVETAGWSSQLGIGMS